MSEATISDIQDYILKQKSEDPIPEHTQYRVTRSIAEGIKGITQLNKGRCNLCGRETEKILPVTLKICISCCNKFIKRGGQLKVIKKEIVEYNCDVCLVRSFVNFYVNPKLCNYCTKRIGRTHKYGIRDMKHDKVRIEHMKEHKGIKQRM